MWKVAILSVIVFPSILIEVSSKPVEADLAVNDYRSKCLKLCNNASGEMEFDEETWTCKCTLIINVNEAEMAIVQQNAKFLNLHLKPNEDFTKSDSRIRRYIVSANNENEIFPKSVLEKETDVILGQVPPPLLPPSALLPNRPLITHDAARRNLLDIRKRLRDLSNHSSRHASAHAEAIRNSLRELSNHVIVPNPDQRLHRARLNQERRARERQRIQRLNNFRIQNGGKLLPPRRPIGLLGASADDVTTVSPRKVNKKQSNKKSDNDDDEVVVPNEHHGIITQPEEFFED